MKTFVKGKKLFAVVFYKWNHRQIQHLTTKAVE